MNKYTKKFCDKYKITEAQYYGREWTYKGLYINEDKIPLGFNPKISYDLVIEKAKILPKTFNPIVERDLYLNSLEKINTNFTGVKRALNARKVKEIGNNITFNVDYLYLENLKEINTKVTFNIGRDLYLYSIEKINANITFNVGNSLILSSLRVINTNIIFNVGDSLSLYSLQKINTNTIFNVGTLLSIKKLKEINADIEFNVGLNLCADDLEKINTDIKFNVGNDLDLFYLNEINKNITFNVGNNLSVISLREINTNTIFNVKGYIENKKLNFPKLLFNPIFKSNGKKYIIADGMLAIIIYQRQKVYKCKRIYNDEEFYIVTDDYGKWAHGNNIKEAKESLLYKISNRDTSKFKSLTLESKLSLEKAIECYRVITGACEWGVRNFLEQKGIKPTINKTFSIQEIINFTKNQYGNDAFNKFFNK